MTSDIRRLTLAEIGTLLDWAALEGWNPGVDDAVAFQAADPDGFLGAFVDGQMVAGIAAVAYDADYGFIGLYICHRDWRGRGHGKAVWDAGLAYLGARTIGLDGVAEQQDNYAAMGFVPAYETIRMSGTLVGERAGEPDGATPGGEDIAALDRQCFPSARNGFLAHWLAPPRQVLVHRVDGVVEGYGLRRRCRDASKIGPLFARTTSAAMALLASQSGPVHIDVPAGQTQWLAALSGLGFTKGFTTMRMYRGDPPPMHLPFVFGVSSLELG